MRHQYVWCYDHERWERAVHRIVELQAEFPGMRSIKDREGDIIAAYDADGMFILSWKIAEYLRLNRHRTGIERE